MRLFLTSSTITPGLVSSFEALFQKSIYKLNVLFINDAMHAPILQNSPEDIVVFIEEDTHVLKHEYGWNLDIVKISENIPHDLSSYDLIYINGGASGYLASVFRETGFENTLLELIKNDFPVVGSSGGSMVFSKVQDVASWYIGEAEPEAKHIPGLGLIDFQLYPHFEKNVLNEILNSRDANLDYYLLQDNHAISVYDDYLVLHGDDIIYLPKGQ